MESCNENTHSHHHHADLKGIRLLISIILNVLITIAQIAGGIISGSLSLLSDALHNFSDVLALVISYIADRLTLRKTTTGQTFGYKRAEIIAALFNSASLLAIAVLLIKEGLLRFFNPVEVDSKTVMGLAFLSIVLNGLSVAILHKESSESVNIKSAYLHLLTDMFTSVAVLAGGFAMMYYKAYWVDPILSILISIYLVSASLGLLKETLGVLMQFTPGGIDIHEIRTLVSELKSVENIHHVHLWQLNDKEIHLEAHIDFCKDLNLGQVTEIISEIEILVKDRFGISHTIFQPEIGRKDDKNMIVDSCEKSK